MNKGLSILIFIALARFVVGQQVEPPLPPSPIAEFRGWLKQSPEERRVALSKRSEKARQILEQKIEEYSALPQAERDRRLNATELQWYVTRLLPLSADRRAAAMQQVPVLWQPMVMERLSAWDKLSPQLQSEAWQHKIVREYLSAPADQQATFMKTLSDQERNALTQRLDQWRILPATERRRLDERVDEFFKMQPEKQQQALNSFSDVERQNMEKTLQAFRALSAEQRELCVKSFAQFANKFAAMSRPEQIAFLKNAERWQAMSQNERDMWRKVVAIVPPMPPTPIQAPPLPTLPLPAAK